MGKNDAWNHWCAKCKKWVHKRLIAEHEQKRHANSLAAMPKYVRQEFLAAQEREKKVQEQKTLLKEIDRANFPPGTRLTSNLAYKIPRGGGFMSNRRKF